MLLAAARSLRPASAVVRSLCPRLLSSVPENAAFLASNAAKDGGVGVGDVLVGVTAVRYIGGDYLGKARPERDIFPADAMDFDTVVDAISSNEEPECKDVILRFRKA